MEFIFKKDTTTENSKSGETSYNRTATLNYSDPDKSVSVNISVSGTKIDVGEFLIENFLVSKVNDRTDASFKMLTRQKDLDGFLSEEDITTGEQQGEEFDNANPPTPDGELPDE